MASKYINAHPLYQDYVKYWERCRDCYKGEDAVKLKGSEYLPYLSEQESQEYNAYKDRALFLNTFFRTVTGLVGGAMRKPPLIEVPSSLEPYLEDIDMKGTHINDFIRNTLVELFITGRQTIVVDQHPSGRPYLASYVAENFVNWHSEDMVNLFAVFCEEVDVLQDKFSHETIEQYRAYSLEEDGVHSYVLRDFYNEETQEADTQVIEDNVLTFRGMEIQALPVTVINFKECGFNIQEPPLLDLANVCISHYRSSADLEHGRHFTALPQAYITGVDPDEYNQGVHVGSGTAWVIPNESAKVGFLEFSGQGLGSLERAIEQKEQMMAVLGARLLEGPKGVEAAETARIRQNTETSILSSMVQSVGNGIQKSLEFMAMWEGEAIDAVNVQMNKDFIDVRLPYQEVIALVQSYQMGGISLDTLLYNLKQGEVIPHDVTVEEEMERILAGQDQPEPYQEALEGGQEEDLDNETQVEEVEV
jgi:hypothetical protein